MEDLSLISIRTFSSCQIEPTIKSLLKHNKIKIKQSPEKMAQISNLCSHPLVVTKDFCKATKAGLNKQSIFRYWKIKLLFVNNIHNEGTKVEDEWCTEKKLSIVNHEMREREDLKPSVSEKYHFDIEVQ